jgi:hypothetical protein
MTTYYMIFAILEISTIAMNKSIYGPSLLVQVSEKLKQHGNINYDYMTEEGIICD